MARAKAKVIELSDPTNGGEEAIEFSVPYAVSITLEGVSDLLFHRWNCEAVSAKASAAKGSAAKKTDDIESYVYRNEDDYICIPGEYLRQSMILAAKSRQDPRSPRKSAMDLFKAGIVSLTQLASLGTKEWDYLDTRRVVVQRSGINRTRPGFRAGWVAEFVMMITTPEYISYPLFCDVLHASGRLVGIGDFRPTYGRFQVKNIEIVED
jgi:hypothetical protein